MKNFDEILQAKFGVGVPILAEEIVAAFPGVTRVAVYQNIEKSIASGGLQRYERGVYYIPRQGRFGAVPLSAEAVVERKYISDGRKVFGYYSGLALENRSGISQQVPAVLEVTTNAASKRVRSLGSTGGWKNVVIRKPRCEVTSENVEALKFLDAITSVSPSALDASAFRSLKQMASRAGRSSIYKYASYYPAKTSKRLVESEAVGVFA